MDATRPNCGDDHIAIGKDAARPVSRRMHGAVGDEAVHGWKLGRWVCDIKLMENLERDWVSNEAH